MARNRLKPEDLRSHRWFGGGDLSSQGHRSRALQMGYGRDDFGGKPCVIDANIDGDLNPAGAGIWELPGMGRSKPGIGKQYVP